MKISVLLKDLECKYICKNGDFEIDDIVMDSRKAGTGSLFLCQKGTKTDSHCFIRDVYEKGCRNFIVENDYDYKKEGIFGANIIKTDNSRRAWAFLSEAFFSYPSKELTLIGITGTKGKTSLSYILRSVLQSSGELCGVIGTNGCMIGEEFYETINTTPDSYEISKRLREMCDRGCRYAVMECSSQGFKMHRTDALTFDYGIFLNLSRDHIGPLEHENMDEYISCKSMLARQSKIFIANLDSEYTELIIERSGIKRKDAKETSEKKRLFFFSTEKKADIYSENIEFERNMSSTFSCRGLANGKFNISLAGRFNISNTLPAIAVAALESLDMEKVKDSLENVKIKGRMEVAVKNGRYAVLVDYAHNEVSMENLLATLKNYQHKRLVIVFGCGGNRSVERRTGMGKAAAEYADYTIMTADNSRFEKTEDIISQIYGAYIDAGGEKEKCVRIPDRREAIRYALYNAKDGDIIAVIGKGHEDYQEEYGIRKHFSDIEVIEETEKEIEDGGKNREVVSR